ncbi:unnamed protein product [Symbiodinium sp. KB8]|nr:unnamed protein product [Symbiodinium sp. KB8]
MMSCILFLLSAVSAQHTASLAPLAATSPSPSAPSQRLAAFDAHTGDRQEAGEGRHLVVLGAVLAGACIFSGVILGFLLLSSVAGLAVPLLGALPSTSAAVFAMQVLAVGSTSPLNDLAVPLRWMAPQPDSMLVGCILLLAFVWLARRAALRLHRKQLDQSSAEPHGLSPGSWELRALGLVAFPLAAASTQLAASLDQADSALAGLVVSTVILCFLTNQAVLAFRFLHQVLEEGSVTRTPLPAGAGQVFIDKRCDELRALPLGASPGEAMSEWLGTSGWWVAPSVALIEETEWTDEAMETFRERMAHSSLEVPEDNTRQRAPDSLDDELQDQPLLEAKSEGADSTGDGTPSTLPEPQVLFRGGASAVKECHPLTVKSTVCFDGPTREACAGVACLPWLDCAVPSSALRRVEDVSGCVTLRVHPSQLTGKLSSGQYAACFDWGTKSPWRWPVDLSAQVFLGLWLGLQRSGRQVLPAAAGLIDACTLLVVAGLVLFFFKVSAWEHWLDNAALRSAYLMVLQVVSLRVMWDPAPGKANALEVPASVLAAGLALVPVFISLLSGVCLVGVVLGRLETQGLRQDRMLQMSVAGWADAEARGGPGFSGCTAVPHFPRGDPQDVEVILPGSKKAFAILLPARSRIRIQHFQLLPPATRGAGAQALLPPGGDGDRPRLPLPPWFLFPVEGKATVAEVSKAPPGVVPLAALLSPGRPGTLIYAEACHNRGDVEWQQAVLGFFRDEGSALADEALCHIAAAQDDARLQPCLVVVEVLPSLASEFMDERCQLPEASANFLSESRVCLARALVLTAQSSLGHAWCVTLWTVRVVLLLTAGVTSGEEAKGEAAPRRLQTSQQCRIDLEDMLRDPNWDYVNNSATRWCRLRLENEMASCCRVANFAEGKGEDCSNCVANCLHQNMITLCNQNFGQACIVKRKPFFRTGAPDVEAWCGQV